MRLFWILLALSTAVLVPFLIWGDWWEQSFSLAGSRAWLSKWGAWAWLAGILLLALDVVLPVPGTIVMSTLGWLYGWWWGGLAAAAGSLLAGFTAYIACRSIGEKAAAWILGEKDAAKMRQVTDKHGPAWIAISRALPILPEVTTCLAGLTRMPPARFTAALACGSIPTGFLYASLGHWAAENAAAAAWALPISLLLPIALWWLLRPVLPGSGESSE